MRTWACLLLAFWGSVATAQAVEGTPHFWPAESAPATMGPTPDELAGFPFGASPAAVARRCRRAGHEYTRDADGLGHCDGAAAPRDLKARMTFVFCANRLCEMRAVVEDDSRVATYANALRSLRAAFGAPPQRRLRVDHVCLGEMVGGRGDHCLEDRGAGVRHWWEVSGTEIFLALERRAHGPALEIAYRDAARLAALSATSD